MNENRENGRNNTSKKLPFLFGNASSCTLDTDSDGPEMALDVSSFAFPAKLYAQKKYVIGNNSFQFCFFSFFFLLSFPFFYFPVFFSFYSFFVFSSFFLLFLSSALPSFSYFSISLPYPLSFLLATFLLLSFLLLLSFPLIFSSILLRFLSVFLILLFSFFSSFYSFFSSFSFIRSYCFFPY